MEFPTEAAYTTLSYGDTSLLLSEMQRQSASMDASRDEVDDYDEEGYEINIGVNNTFEISAADTCNRSALSGETNSMSETKKPWRSNSLPKHQNKRSSYGMLEAPLSPHIDTSSIMDPPVGKDPENEEEYMTADEGLSLVDTLSDLADGMDFELDTMKGLLYKVKRERDTYKRANHSLQKSLSEAIALKSSMEAEHREAFDVIICSANDDKRHLEDELQKSTVSKRKLKKLVGEMMEEKAALEEKLKEQEDKLKNTQVGDLATKLEEERGRHFAALSDAITDLEAKFENDLKEAIKEKDEEMQRKEKEHKAAVDKIESILKEAMEEKEAEIKKEKKTQQMAIQALEQEKIIFKEDLKRTRDDLNMLKEEHAVINDVHDMEVGELRKEFDQMKSRMQKQFAEKESFLQEELSIHSKAIDELETKLHVESMQCQTIASEVVIKNQEIVSKDAEIITLEKKLAERNANYTREYDRMKAHLMKMCNLVESSSADRDRAREETKKIKAEHEKQNMAYMEETERLKRKFKDGAREMAQHLAESNSGESEEQSERFEKLTRDHEKQIKAYEDEIERLKHNFKELAGSNSCESEEKSELLEIKKGEALNPRGCSSQSKDHSGNIALLTRLEAMMKERDQLAAQLHELTVGTVVGVQDIQLCTSDEESVMHLGDINSGGMIVDDSSPTVAADPDHQHENLCFKVKELEYTLVEKNNEIAELNEKLVLSQQYLDSTLNEKSKEVADLNEKLALANQEAESVNVMLSATTQELDVAGTIEQDLCEYSMNKIDKRLSIENSTHDTITQERNQLRNEVSRLEILLKEAQVVHIGNDPALDAATSLNEMMREIAQLEETLAQQEVEMSDYKIKVSMHERLEKERDGLAAELEQLKKAQESNDTNEEIAETCLSHFEKDNESLRASLTEKTKELARLEVALAKQEDELSECKSKASMCERLEKERDNLKIELTTLKATVEAPDEESALAKLGEDLSNLKMEHRVEIKLLKKDHATTKTKCKLLKKELQKFCAEQQEMLSAYEAERQSNADMSLSLEEMVSLLESERVLHSDQIDSLRAKLDKLKASYTRLKKKRVPIDAAYKATRILLDSYEASQLTPLKLDSSGESEVERIKATLSAKDAELQALSKEFQAAKSKEAKRELQLSQTTLIDSMDISIKAAVAEKQTKIEHLQKEFRELSKTYSDDMNATREELTKEMSRLHEAHNDSMRAHSEAIENYETEIADATRKIAEKTEVISSLTEQLNDTRAELNSMKSTLVTQDEEVTTKLHKQLEDETLLKEESLIRVQVLEGELTEKATEIEVLTQQLSDTKDGLDELEAELEVHVEKDLKKIQSLEQKNADLNTVIDELKNKLTVSEDNLQSINAKHIDDLEEASAIHEKIKEELATSQAQVDELNVKLDYCEGKLATAQHEQNQLITEGMGMQEELTKACDQIEQLNENVSKYQQQVAALQSECSQLKQSADIATCSQREFEGEAKKHCEETELLKKQMAAAEIKSKQVLKDEVDTLKQEFNQVISTFEKELVDTCETNANEVNEMQRKLTESEEMSRMLNVEINELNNQKQEIRIQLDQKMALEVDLAMAHKELAGAKEVEEALSKLKDEHTTLLDSFDEMKQTKEELESSKEELLKKLHETSLSIEDHLRAFKDLREDHSSLRTECEMLRGDSSSLHELVSSLTNEKERLMNDIGEQADQYRNVCDIKMALEKEIEKYRNHQSSLEILVSNLRDEIDENRGSVELLKKDISHKQQLIDTLKHDNKLANSHLDEMVTYCDKLKSDFAETSASLRQEIDNQAHSMRDVINELKNQLLATETEKDENRRMYEKDIELQQNEVESWRKKDIKTLEDLDSLTSLVAGLKETLEEEKLNSQLLRSHFKESESERNAAIEHNNELQDTLASKIADEAIMQERIRLIEAEVSDLRPMPDKLTKMMKTESVMRDRIHLLESQLNELGEVEKRLADAQNTEAVMRDRIHGLENQSMSFQMEYKENIKRKEEEISKLRVLLQECREKLQRLMQENEKLKRDNVESTASLKIMLNEAIRGRADSEESLQVSLQLLEQQKRVDIKRKGELCKLEQTVEILKSKERYLESYVSSLKNQINRNSR